MGCLTVCRWCCCCFLVTYNILLMILGILCFIVGCLAVWGYWVVRQAIDSNMQAWIDSVKSSELTANMNPENLHEAIETLMASVAVVFLVLGVLMIILSCIGCCGACFAVPSCLIIYVVVVGLEILASIIVIAIWFTNRDIYLVSIENKMKREVAAYKGASAKDASTMLVDFMQLSLGCCGVDNGEDFNRMATNWDRSYNITRNDGRKVNVNVTQPVSCCRFEMEDTYKIKDKYCPYNGTSSVVTNRYSGCYSKVKRALDDFGINRLFYCVPGAILLELLLIAGALVIYCFKRQEQDDVPHSGVQYKMQPQMA